MVSFKRKKKGNNIVAVEWDLSGISEGVDYITREGPFVYPSHTPLNRSLRDISNSVLQNGANGMIIVGRCDSADLYLGALITMLNEPNIDLAQDEEIVMGVIVSDPQTQGLYHDFDNPFPDNAYVNIYTTPVGRAYCYINGAYRLVDLSRVIGRRLSEVREMVGSITPNYEEDARQRTEEERQRVIERQLLKEAQERKNTFIVNEYITLKLEGKKTNIYVDGKKFQQCKFLMLNLEEGKEYKEIHSIDDAAKVLSNRMESYPVPEVKPSEEFWGHCSNIQAWVENDYDVRVIHSNLGIPLLKKLIECGDQKALISWKEEIMFRIQEGGFNTITQYKKEIDKYFTPEEINLVKEKLIEIIKSKPNSDIINEDKIYNVSSYKILLEVYYFLEKINLEKIKKKKGLHGDPFAASGGFMEGGMVNEPSLHRPNEPNIHLTNNPSLDDLEREFDTTFDAGLDQDNDVSDHDDFVETVLLAMERFRVLYGEPRSITIYSHPNMKMVAELGNHFNTITAITEYDEVINMLIVRRWVSNTQIPDHNRLYFKNENDQLIQTGELIH